MPSKKNQQNYSSFYPSEQFIFAHFNVRYPVYTLNRSGGVKWGAGGSEALECLGSEKRIEREICNPLIIICLPLPLGFENLTTALNRKNGNLSSQSDIWHLFLSAQSPLRVRRHNPSDRKLALPCLKSVNFRMNFWCLKFSKKITKQFDKFLP